CNISDLLITGRCGHRPLQVFQQYRQDYRNIIVGQGLAPAEFVGDGVLNVPQTHERYEIQNNFIEKLPKAHTIAKPDCNEKIIFNVII
ncbi:MAG: hypothetical protein ACI4RS_05760, partial [Monoglobaceae bacterium]